MLTSILLALAGLSSCGPTQTPQDAPPAGVAWIAAASLPGNARDRSGLETPIPGVDLPQDLLGSIGSSLTYTGVGNLYLAGNDRGPKDGAVPFVPRFQTLEITADPTGGKLEVRLVGTTLYRDGQVGLYTGLSSDFDAKRPDGSRRLDPEGLRVSRTGTLFTSDEYGPWIDEWTAQGTHLRRLELPKRFGIAKPGANPEEEFPPSNRAGRQPNRGMEGLARSPDGSRLYGLMQSPLIQDGGLDEKNQRIGFFLRLLEVELAGGATREFVYELESEKNGANEIVAVGPLTFVVIERDGKKGPKAEFKRLYRIDVSAASDVSKLEALPSRGLPEGVEPVRKSLLIDFLDPRWGLAGKAMPEKIEGLAFGPDLADGRRLLLVSIDNDCEPEAPNTFWAFAIDPQLLPGFQAQAFDTPWKP